MGRGAAEPAQFVFAALPGRTALGPNPDGYVNLPMVRCYPLAYILAIKSFKQFFYLAVFLYLELPALIKQIKAAKIDRSVGKTFRR